MKKLNDWLIIVGELVFCGIVLRFGKWIGEDISERVNVSDLILES